MKKLFGLLFFLLICAGWTHGVGYIPQTYYISPSGSDSNNGTSSGTPWLTPNHAMNCGDVISAAAGSYASGNFQNGNWGIVSGCSSTAGVYFASLKCSVAFSCTIADTSSNGLWVNVSNWAVIGWVVSSTAGACYIAEPTGPTIHHVAFINDIANGCLNGGFALIRYYSVHTDSVDYFACVGCIAYNTAPGTSGCFSGISLYEPANFDTKSGTHMFISGAFSWGNIVGCSAHTDGNGVIFDTWNANSYTGQAVVEQNLLIGNGGAGAIVYLNTAAPVYLFSNTMWGNHRDSSFNLAGEGGELTYNDNTTPGLTSATNNNVQATVSSVNGITVYGAQVTAGDSTNTINGNYILGVSGNNTSGIFTGSNTIATPNFVNPTVPGAPSCSTFTLATACMASVTANFVAQTGGAAALGYQPPSKCTPDTYFPPWLAGILPIGLITQPCGTN